MSKTYQYFKEILTIPRPSKQEEKIRMYLIGWATSRWYSYRVDWVGNLVVYVPAKGSDLPHDSCQTGTSRTPVILQSHMDMVCVKKPESAHDFLNDPIRVYEKDGFLHAHDTTLGADNGIGIALSMAACDFESHPPLEIVFTVDEEAGMSGIEGLDFSLLSGKKVINLDSENEDEICISSAGGKGVIATKRFDESEQSLKSSSAANRVFRFSISGMRGGHSGCEIHENRGNAIRSMIEFLVSSDVVGDLYSFRSGTAANVIPSKAEVFVEVSDADAFMQSAEKYLGVMREQFDCPDVRYSCEAFEQMLNLRPVPRWREIFSDVLQFHSGVYVMSEKIPDLVQTSMNLGILEMSSESVKLVYLARSSVNFELADLVESLVWYLSERGYIIETDRGYPGWQDDPDSELLCIAREEIWSELGKEPKVIALHAGLECGAMVTGLWAWVNAISIGPNVYDVHGVDERVEIASIDRTERILEGILRRL